MRIEVTITQKELIESPCRGMPLKVRERLMLKDRGIRFIGADLPSFMDPNAPIAWEGELRYWDDPLTKSKLFIQEINDEFASQY